MGGYRIPVTWINLFGRYAFFTKSIKSIKEYQLPKNNCPRPSTVGHNYPHTPKDP